MERQAGESVVVELARSLGCCATDGETFQLACRACYSYFPGANTVSVALLSKDEQELHYYQLVAESGESHRHSTTLATADTAAGAAVRLKEVIHTGNLHSSTRSFLDWRHFALASSAVSVASVPLVVSQKVLGCLNLTAPAEDAFSRHILVLEAVAAAVAPYIGLQRFRREFQAVDDILLRVMLPHVAERLQQLYVQTTSERLLLQAALQVNPDARPRTRLPQHAVSPSCQRTSISPSSSQPAAAPSQRTSQPVTLEPLMPQQPAAMGTRLANPCEVGSRSRGDRKPEADSWSQERDATTSTSNQHHYESGLAQRLVGGTGRPLQFAGRQREEKFLAWWLGGWQWYVDLTSSMLVLAGLLFVMLRQYTDKDRLGWGLGTFAGRVMTASSVVLNVCLSLGRHVVCGHDREKLMAGFRMFWVCIYVLHLALHPVAVRQPLPPGSSVVTTSGALVLTSLAFTCQVRWGLHLQLHAISYGAIVLATVLLRDLPSEVMRKVLMVQLFLGFALPTAALYMQERTLRAIYAKLHPPSKQA